MDNKVNTTEHQYFQSKSALSNLGKIIVIKFDQLKEHFTL